MVTFMARNPFTAVKSSSKAKSTMRTQTSSDSEGQPPRQYLPNEIWHLIIAHISEEELKCLYSVNSFFLHIALDLRYRELALLQPTKDTMKLLTRMSDPSLTSRVKTLELCPNAFAADTPHIDSDRAKISLCPPKKTLYHSLRQKIMQARVTLPNSDSELSSGTQSDSAFQCVAKIMPGLKAVTTLHLHWMCKSENCNPSDIARALGLWDVFGANLRGLDISLWAPVEGVRVEWPPASHLRVLESLKISISERNSPQSIPDPTYGLSLSGFSQEDLAKFITQLSPSLVSLTITSGIHIFGFTTLFEQLGCLPRLRKLTLAVPLDQGHWPDISSLTSFLITHKGSLEHLDLRHSSCDRHIEVPAPEWPARVLTGVFLPALRSLTIDLNFVPRQMARNAFRQSAMWPRLESLSIRRRLLESDHLVLLADAYREAGTGQLRELKLSVPILNRTVVDTLANAFPGLRVLDIGVVFIGSYTFNVLSGVERFRGQMKGARYDAWLLTDLTVSTMRSNLPTHHATAILRQCIPGLCNVQDTDS
ncbi:hypothetical protein HGRIS_002109 [Hohenbuehelia grisea]|uniref:F-box domain-containing protein n=1 Tax=Hohenbuehelia grisea TaxID=104357 RepID=A0ABR3JKK1_9AGAR